MTLCELHRGADFMVGDAAGLERRYWYAVAVFRDAADARSSLDSLCSGTFHKGDLLVLCEQSLPAKLDGEASTLSPALLSFVHALNGNGAADAAMHGGDHSGQSRIYSHLLQDVAEGAVVLVASAGSSEQQLEGARLLLRGNSECVVTHEIVDRERDVG